MQDTFAPYQKRQMYVPYVRNIHFYFYKKTKLERRVIFNLITMLDMYVYIPIDTLFATLTLLKSLNSEAAMVKKN